MIPPYEQGLILSHILKKSREYVLTHPEIQLNEKQKQLFAAMSARRLKNEPMAYILGHKEFYGLDFKVNRHTLIPRPETEMLLEEVIRTKPKNSTIIDVGTGSGNIVISLCKNITNKNNYYGIDISEKALRVAKYNAKKHEVDKKIKFLKGDLLKPLIQNLKFKIQNYIIIANLPYLSEKIYNNTLPDVKHYEPKSALISGNNGLTHYKKLFYQIAQLKKIYSALHITCYMEFSPEQKSRIEKLVKKYFPKSKSSFQKDLSGKWRAISFSI